MLLPRLQQPRSSHQQLHAAALTEVSTSVATPTAGCKASTLQRSSTTSLDKKLHQVSSIKRRWFQLSSSRITTCGWSAVAVPFASVVSLAARLLRDEPLLDGADTPARLHEQPTKRLHAILQFMDHYLGCREPFGRQVHLFFWVLATSPNPPRRQAASDNIMLPP
ncbi:unnamed protein product, partial [Mesorhabditis spiculigera]